MSNTRFTFPPASCDAHCHVFGPSARFPFAPNRKYEPDDSPKETLAALHERMGIDRAVIVQASAHGTDNRAMLDALQWRPDRYRGVAIIDSSIEDSALAQMDDTGVRGIRFNFVQSLGGYPDPDEFRAAVGRAKSLGWHVVLHMKGEDLLALENEIAALTVPFVVDHMGRVDAQLGVDQPAFSALLRLLQREHAWVKVSGAERMVDAPYDGALPFARALVEAAPERVLWGTDFPHPNLAATVNEDDQARLLELIAPSEQERHRLLVANPAKLYGFE